MWLLWLLLSTATPEAHQRVVVRAVPGAAVHVVSLAVEERRTAGPWRQVLGPYAATIGWAGFAPPGEKREGDGRTPTGAYPLTLVFGDAASAPRGVRLPYRQATDDDVWVDDPASPDYNRWVRGPPRGTSYERLRRQDALYRLAAVVGYNSDPVIPGNGSAIFLHVWSGPGEPTIGCVSLSRRNLLKVLRRLRPERTPTLVLNPSRPTRTPR